MTTALIECAECRQPFRRDRTPPADRLCRVCRDQLELPLAEADEPDAVPLDDDGGEAA